MDDKRRGLDSDASEEDIGMAGAQIWTGPSCKGTATEDVASGRMVDHHTTF